VTLTRDHNITTGKIYQSVRGTWVDSVQDHVSSKDQMEGRSVVSCRAVVVVG
jgi:hypothetical protein